ncbi:MAG: hypothetical protein R8P61_30645 [Bacteroidia bacterium]|nr:hypothetical protein [Bacteroidia bacterium]
MKVQGYLLILICFISACDFLGNTSQESQREPISEVPAEENEGQELRKDPASDLAMADSAITPIDLIKEEFAAINADELYMDTIPFMDQSTEGGEIIAFFNTIGELRKVQSTLLGEMGKQIEEYYVKEGKLFFAFKQRHNYNRPMYQTDPSIIKEGIDTEIFDPEKTKISEYRYYFDKDQSLIRLIDAEKNILEEEQIELEEEEKLIAAFDLIQTRIQQNAEKEEEQTDVEDELNPELHKWMKSIAEEQNFTYMYQAFDLNGDGKDEYLCGLRGQFWCGSGGCSFIVVEQTDGGLKLLTRGGPTFSPHFISTEENQGWHSIILDPTQGQTAEGEAYLNYPVLIYQDSAYEQIWIDNLDNTERIDKLLEGATEVLSDERTFHKVLIN